MGSLAVAQSKPTNGSFASLLEKLTGVTNEGYDGVDPFEDLGPLGEAAHPSFGQVASQANTLKRSKLREPIARTSRTANPLATELSYDSALRRHARHATTKPQGVLSQENPDSQFDSARSLRETRFQESVQEPVQHEKLSSYQHAFQNESTNKASQVETLHKSSSRRVQRGKGGKPLPARSVLASNSADGQPLAAMETFPPIASVSLQDKKFRSSSISSRKPRLPLPKPSEQLHDCAGDEVNGPQNASIAEAESEGITKIQLAALIAELDQRAFLPLSDDQEKDELQTELRKSVEPVVKDCHFGIASSHDALPTLQSQASEGKSPFETPLDAAPPFRSTTVSVRLNESEFSTVRQRASAAGVSAAAYIRACVLVESEPQAEINRALAAIRQAAMHSQAGRFRGATGSKSSNIQYRPPWFQRLRQFLHSRIRPNPAPDSKPSPVWRATLGPISSF